MNDFLDALQWPAMGLILLSVWWIGSTSPRWRAMGFWSSVVANVLWIVWGVHDDAWAVVFMQIGLATLNIRGGIKNERSREGSSETEA